MNLKHLFVGVALAGVGLLSATTQANAFSFKFLGSNANSSFTDYNFEFTADAFDVVNPNETLLITGFEGVQSASLQDPKNNVAGVLFARDAFNVGSITATSASFNTKSTLNSISGPVRFQTFVVTAVGVPTGIVDPSFPGAVLPPVAVPEPLTLLGAMSAAGFGAAFKRRFSKSA